MIRLALGAVVRRIIKKIPLPSPRVIYDREGRSPYLSRYYVTARPTMRDGSTPFDQNGNPKIGVTWPDERWGLYVHKFHRSDEDGGLHNHPWAWSISFVLAGGYSEERRDGDRVRRRDVLPFSFNFIGHDDFHRVDLLEKDAWTLFLVGPKVSSWGFWDRETVEFTPWREYITRIRGERWAES